MTNTFDTSAQECTATSTTFQVEKPCEGSNVSVSLSTEEPTHFNFGLQDIAGMQIVEGGMLLITFTDGQTLTVDNYTEALGNSQFQNIELSDGEVINLTKLAEGLSSPSDTLVADASALNDITPASGEEFVNLLSKPNVEMDATSLNYTLVEGETYVSDFNQVDIKDAQLNEKGELVISFNDGTQTILTNFSAIENATDIPQMTLADGTVISVTDILTTVMVEPVEEIAAIAPKAEEIAAIEPASGDIAQTLASIEPAAGDNSANTLGNTGAGFGSSVNGGTAGNNDAIGAIGVTELAFDRPTVQDEQFVFNAPMSPPALVVNSVSLYEDNTVNLGVFAAPSDNADSISIVISDIEPGWAPDLTDPTTANGTFDATAGTWTINLLPGEQLTSGPIFTPPLHSDEDMRPTVTVTQTDSGTGATSVTTDEFDVVVDAVADPINLSATDVAGFEDNPVALNVQTSLIDADGSESITSIVITGMPSGFSLNHGVDNGNGTWTVPLADVPGLELTAPTDYSGTVNLGVTVINEDTPTDTEFDFTNNENTTSTPFNVTFAPVPDAPSLVVNNPIVKEDGSITLDVSATLEDTDGSETLSVQVSNLDASWGVSAGANNGTYNAATGVWTITMPAGQHYSGSLTLTPPADSDVDMTNIQVTATATESDGSNTSISTLVDVVTDAVADMPTLTTSDVTGVGGTSYALNIANAVTDTDGSESLGNVTISGVPTGFSLSAGTEVSTGVWEVSQTNLAGLQLNTPLHYVGNFNLSVSVTTTDTPTDTEVDLTDNQATVTDTLAVNLQVGNANPPTVTVDGTHQVLEDGSVFVDFSAALSANAAPTEVLTVTLTGVDPSWVIATGTNNGTYNAATGTWTITMPAGQNYTGGLTFTPPADSDLDLTGLTVTATATQPGNNTTATDSEGTQVVVDAVADAPTIDAADISGVAGSSIALNVTNAVTDTDGSESLGNVTISGLPTGYSLSAGTQVSPGVWSVAQSDLSGLQLNIPAGGIGTFNLSVSVTTTESVTDTDFDLTNNTATSTDTLSVTVTNNATPPSVNIDGQHQVLEDGSVFVDFTAGLNGNDPTEVLTVTLTGIDSTWTITTGVNNGTYNAATGTWTITMPAGQDYTGGLTFMPPADSDVDMTGLTLTATATQPQTGDSVNNSAPSEIVVDAVADMPTLNVNNANGLEGQVIALDISDALTDTDGSESLGNVTISGLPVGFSLTAGTQVSPGVWSVSQSDLAGLRLNTPQNFSGSVPLQVSVTSTEVVTDNDFDLTNNTATNTQTLNVVIADTANPPTLNVDGTHQVLEDGSVFVPFSATITGDNTEVLTVSVSGIDPAWTIGNVDGTYNAATGTWTITMPAGVDYTGGLTFTPPADSDVDLSGINVTANAFAPTTNTNASITEVIQIIVDAVADAPVIDAGSDSSVVAGQSIALNITDSLTDTDGSESLGNVTISGLPTGYSLSAGTQVSPGVWSVAQGQLSGLQLNTPANGNGNVTLSVSVTSTESVTDNDFNLNNNTATSTDSVVIAVNPDNQPPSVTFGANGSGSAQVLEDGSVLVPITASLNGNAPQQLTVEVSGIPSSWDLSHLAGGSYNAATGTWTITMPAGQDFANSLRFTPPADSDVDLTGLTVTATSTNTTTNQTQSTSTAGEIIVDAVADAPTLNASNASGEEGTSINLNVSAGLTDTDGSESLSKITISGIPNGASLNKGTEVSPGVWELTQGQLNNLKINVPDGVTGTYNLTLSVTSTESVTDNDFNLNNNTATTNTNLRLVVNADDVPVITQPGSPISYERDLTNTNVINGTIVADFGNDGPGEFCIPTGGHFTATGAMDGGNLSSGGVAINVTVNGAGNTYIGKVGGETIFTLKVNPDGSYQFKQFGPLDNASSTNPNERVNLNFDICARDDDGDMSVTTLTVRVQDTGPTAKNDVVTLWSCDWATIGNVITNHNQDTNGQDVLSVEGPNSLTSVTVGGQTFEFEEGGQAMVVQGTYGQLYIFTDGSYAYVSEQGSPNSSHSENFGYTIQDGDGDVSSATLRLNVVKVTQTQNDASDYGNQTHGANTTINGQAAYQTQDTDGAQVFGWTANDVLRGNSGNDAIYGWTGNDTLYGHQGNDVLFGEAGNNKLYGGLGSDVFAIHYDKAGNNNVVDQIMDFNLAQGDVLSLIDVISGFGANDDITDFVRIVNIGGDAMVQVNTNGNGNDFYNVARIENHSGININNLDVQDLYDQGHIDVY